MRKEYRLVGMFSDLLEVELEINKLAAVGFRAWSVVPPSAQAVDEGVYFRPALIMERDVPEDAAQ